MVNEHQPEYEAREALLARLLVERYDNRWWKTLTPEPEEDDDVIIRRRRATAAREQKAFEIRNKTRPRKVA